MRPFVPWSGCFSVVLLKFTPRASGLTGNRKPNARECALNPSSFLSSVVRSRPAIPSTGIQLMRKKNDSRPDSYRIKMWSLTQGAP
jgi:hypothetical protein